MVRRKYTGYRDEATGLTLSGFNRKGTPIFTMPTKKEKMGKISMIFRQAPLRMKKMLNIRKK